jgi:5'/3'-nucleotidase
MLLLLTNDDGIGSAGLAALEAALAPLGDVWVVAPERERSAVGQAISIHRPLRLHPVGERRFALDGTPVDCVYVALHHVLPGPPAVVVSGVNRGANLGTDVLYSGTVGAAREAVLRGVHGVAVSLLAGHAYGPAAAFTRRLVEAVAGTAPARLLNVNVPDGEPRGVRVTTLGKRHYKDEVDARKDPRGRPYYWIGGPGTHIENIGGSDAQTVHEGYLSVTPLSLDQTDRDALVAIRVLVGGSS